MKKLIWCVFGLHDWEIIEQESPEQLKENIISKIEKTYPSSIWGYSRLLNKKVCLHCGKKIDEITPYIDKVLHDYRREYNRQKLANRLFKK